MLRKILRPFAMKSSNCFLNTISALIRQFWRRGRHSPIWPDDKERFYKTAWYLHFKYVAPRITSSVSDELLVLAAQIGTKKRRKAIRFAISDVVGQTTDCSWEVAFWPAGSDPCLQVADYCCWAIQRKYERADVRSYDLISDKIASEFQPFSIGPTTYY